MKYIPCVSLVIVLTSGAHAALPGDSAEGKRLHNASCMTCHDISIYTREDHAVQSLDELKQQVQGCGHMAQKHFSISETDSIIKYLNDYFYHFR